MSCTVAVCGVLLAAVPAIVIVPLYVPTARPEVLTVSVIVVGAVPLVADSESQAASFDAVQARLPPPVLLIVNVLVAGLDPPTTPLKESDDGDNPIAGGVPTVNVTATLSGVLDAPVAAMLTVV